MRTQEPRSRNQDPRHVTQDSGSVTQDPEARIQDSGPKTSRSTSQEIEPGTPGPIPINYYLF